MTVIDINGKEEKRLNWQAGNGKAGNARHILRGMKSVSFSDDQLIFLSTFSLWCTEEETS